jgi:hypothetical protein
MNLCVPRSMPLAVAMTGVVFFSGAPAPHRFAQMLRGRSHQDDVGGRGGDHVAGDFDATVDWARQAIAD